MELFGPRKHLRNVSKPVLSWATIFALTLSSASLLLCVAVLGLAATGALGFAKAPSSTANSSWHLTA